MVRFPFLARRCHDERGQILVVFLFLVAGLLGMVAMVIDVGRFLREQGNLQNIVDAAALAGSQALPDDGVLAQDLALEYAGANDPLDPPATVNITFRCVVGELDGQPNPTHIPATCNPGGNGSFTCSNGRCVSLCVPSESDKCNTIVVGGNKDVSFFFAPVLGIFDGNTGNIRAAACRGSCGGPPTVPLDVVMIIDRSSSMDSTELQAAKDAAKTVLQLYNPSLQHIALGVLGPSNMGSSCSGTNSPGKGVPSGSGSSGSWLPVGFSSDYQTSPGVLNNSSLIVKTINCLTNSSVGTNLGSPINDAAFGLPDAMDELLNNGRPNVKKAILFFTDGAANEPSGGSSSNTGYLNCTANAATTGGDGNGFQTSASSACADGGGEASDVDSGTGTSTSCTNSSKDRHLFYNYNISVGANESIDGIEVRLDARVDSASGTRRLCVQLSWDGGVTWTTAKQTSNIATSQTTYTLGSSSDDWGHTWSNSQLSNGSFRVRVISTADSTSRDFFLDWVAVRVTHSLQTDPCNYAVQQAQVAKDADIEVFTLGYGLQSEDCNDDGAGSPYQGLPVTQALAAMATDSIDETGCDTTTEAAQENADGDHLFCETNAANLAVIFQQAAEVAAAGARLIQLPVW